MKTILYATDFSENSVAALKYANKMADRMGTRLVICHVFGYPVILGMEGLDQPFPHTEENAYKHHRAQLEEFCEKHLGSGWQSPEIQLQAVKDQAALKGIIATADEWHAYLIIVGVKGESGLRELIVGSTTKQLIDKAPCPVLAIPADTNYQPIKTIVYATDFEEEDVYAVRKLAEMAEQFEAEIKIVHISTKQEYEGEMQMEWFKEMLEQKVTYKRIDFELLLSEDIFESLRMYLDEVNADLMVMLEREQKGTLKKLFHRDLVKKMEAYTKVPLLSFRKGNHQLFYFSAVL